MEAGYLVVLVFAFAATANIVYAASAIQSYQCWHCENEPSNTKCTDRGYVETCREGTFSGCQTQVRVDDSGSQHITKGCKSLPVCTSEHSQFLGQCKGITERGSICYFCCTGEKCNSCVSDDGYCMQQDDSKESTGKSSKKSSGKSNKTCKCSTSKSTKSTGKSTKKSSCKSSTSKSTKSTGKSSKKSTGKSSTGKSSKSDECNEDDEGEDNEDDTGENNEDDEGRDDEDAVGGLKKSTKSSDCTCEDDEDDEGESGAHGICAGVVTWVTTLVCYHLIR